MQLILSAAPAQVPAAARSCRTLAHTAYRIGQDSMLLRREDMRYCGGLLALSGRDAPPIPHPDALCAAVLRECRRRQFSGVVLDFEGQPREDGLVFSHRLGQMLQKAGLSLYLPQEQAADANAVHLLCTALSGGNYQARLREAVGRIGAGRLALDVQRLRMDFPLPCPAGEGIPLSSDALRALLLQEQPSIFFSPDLCARYFTYVRSGQGHLVLFDDAATLMRKVKCGASLGISAAFFLWSEIQDLAGELDLR